MSPSIDSVDDDFFEDNKGLTFVLNKDKEEILLYLATGKTLEEAEKKYKVPISTIQTWISPNNLLKSIVKNEICYEDQKLTEAFESQSRNARYKSAFCRPLQRVSTETSNEKSAFCRTINSSRTDNKFNL